MKELIPGIWAWSEQSVKACTTDYAWMGWFGITPDSCKDSTLIVPLDYQWAIAGWPNRTTARMEAVGARTVIFGSVIDGRYTRGLTYGDQLGDIPTNFNGYVMVEDISKVGPALIR
jgi:glycerophosphoryl diester phosphodiesterase